MIDVQGRCRIDSRYLEYLKTYELLASSNTWNFRGGSKRVARFLQESTLIALDFIWKVLLSDRNFATLLDPPPNFSRRFEPSRLYCNWQFIFFVLVNGQRLNRPNQRIFQQKQRKRNSSLDYLDMEFQRHRAYIRVEIEDVVGVNA